MKIPPPWYFEAHQLQCIFASSKKMLPTILFLLAQSETTKSSQPIRSLANFLAPRNLLVSWPSVLVTPRTAKHKCSKKTITRIIFQKFHNLSSCSNLSIPSSLLLLPIYQVSIHTSPSLLNPFITIHQPSLSRYFGKILNKTKYK